jgi:hypothetical protein
LDVFVILVVRHRLLEEAAKLDPQQLLGDFPSVV